MKIPNIYHYIFLGFTDFTFIHYLSILTCYLVQNPDIIYIYYHHLPKKNTKWWDNIQQYITLIYVDIPTHIFGNKITKFQHMADVIRLEKLIKYGGVYFDLDIICLKKITKFFNNNCVMGLQCPNTKYQGLCNAVIIAEPNSVFLTKWYQEYVNFSHHKWDYHSVTLPLLLSKINSNYIKIEKSESFFPFDWNVTDIMINRKYDNLLKNSYVFHLWESEWDKSVLKINSPHLFTYNSTFTYYLYPILKPYLDKFKLPSKQFIPKPSIVKPSIVKPSHSTKTKQGKPNIVKLLISNDIFCIKIKSDPIITQLKTKLNKLLHFNLSEFNFDYILNFSNSKISILDNYEIDIKKILLEIKWLQLDIFINQFIVNGKTKWCLISNILNIKYLENKYKLIKKAFLTHTGIINIKNNHIITIIGIIKNVNNHKYLYFLLNNKIKKYNYQILLDNQPKIKCHKNHNFINIDNNINIIIEYYYRLDNNIKFIDYTNILFFNYKKVIGIYNRDNKYDKNLFLNINTDKYCLIYIYICPKYPQLYYYYYKSKIYYLNYSYIYPLKKINTLFYLPVNILKD